MSDAFFDPSLKKKKKKKVVQFNEDPLGADADPTQAPAAAQSPVEEEVKTVHEQIKKSMADPDDRASPAAPPAEEDPAAMFGDLKKKKKKKDVPADFEAPAEDKPADAADGEFDLSDLKKKKKPKKKLDDDAFDTEAAPSKKTADAAEAGGDDDDDEIPDGKDLELLDEEEDLGENPFENAAAGVEGGAINMLEPGREPWAGSDRDYKYPELLIRFYALLHAANPALASNMGKRYTIAPPQLMREGNKKSIFANITDICRKMHREPAHVISFMLAEMGTTGSVDGSGRLVIKGRFLGKQIENVLRRYIVEYVTCKTCKSPDTLLTKENRIYFMTCESCGSRRSVGAIKSGFQAQIGKRRLNKPG